MSVLVVEDNPISAKAMRAALEKHGFPTAVVYTGTQALEYLGLNPQIQVVVVDLVLPEMDGFQLIHRMKLDPAMKGTPVVICTTLRDIEAVRRSAQLGCRHYVVKPLIGEELVKKVLEAMATGKQIIHTKKAVMDQLELDAMAYDDIIYTFQKIVEEKVFLVEGMLAGRESESKFIELSDLKESGSMLGTDRLLDALELLHEPDGKRVAKVDREDFRKLLREMTSLQKVLRPARRVNVVI